jgi:hypothetical protein
VYDPDTGTFLSRDPLRTLNRYSAFNNSPPNRQDPEGLAPIGDWKNDFSQYGGMGTLHIGGLQRAQARMTCLYLGQQRASLYQVQQYLERQLQMAAGDPVQQKHLMDLLSQLARGIGSLDYGMAALMGQLGQVTQDQSWLQIPIDLLRGIGDTVSLGLSEKLRTMLYGEYGQVMSRGSYFAGSMVGTLMQSVLTGNSSGLARLYGMAYTGMDVYGMGSALYQGDALGFLSSAFGAYLGYSGLRTGSLGAPSLPGGGVFGAGGKGLAPSAGGEFSRAFRNMEAAQPFGAMGLWDPQTVRRALGGTPRGVLKNVYRTLYDERETFEQWRDFRRRFNIPSKTGWSLEHLVIKKRWFEGENPVFAEGTLPNQVLRSIGNAGWNLVPVRMSANRWLYQHKAASWAFTGTVYAASGGIVVGLYELSEFGGEKIARGIYGR